MKMQTIYQYNSDFDKGSIIEKINELSEKVKEEQDKDDSEYNKDIERKLIYAQLIQGMKLSIM